MKVALLLIGQPRKYLESYRKIKENIIDAGNDVDVFIHTWIPNSKIDIDNKYHTNEFVNNNIEEHLQQLYKPKKLIIQEQLVFKNSSIDYQKTVDTFILPYSDIGGKGCLYKLYSQWYSFMKANELKNIYALDNDIQYDVVIKLRFDIFPNKKLDFNLYDLTKLHGSEQVSYIDMVCDWCNFGNDDIMNIAASLFNFIPYIYKNKDKIWCSESGLYKLMTMNNIECIKENLWLTWA
jgi:hypothetical protein